MELRAAIFTILSIGILVALFGFVLRPFWLRIWRYLCAIKQQDEYVRLEEAQNRKLRAEAEEELETGVSTTEENRLKGIKNS